MESSNYKKSKDEIDLARWRYKVNRKLERRRNRTKEQVIEHSKKEMESKRRKIEMEFNKMLKEKYGIFEEPNRNGDSNK